MQRIYLDNASTTRVSNEVLSEMLPAFGDTFGNANSLHSFGRDAQNIVDKARDRVANAINAERGEIYFTSGATESNNWVLKGIVLRYYKDCKGDLSMGFQIKGIHMEGQLFLKSPKWFYIVLKCYLIISALHQ